MRACRRFISSSAPLRAISSPFHSFRVSRFLQLLSDHKETKHFVYPLVEAIHDANSGARTLQYHLNLIQGQRAAKREVKWNQVLLQVNDVSTQELERWKPVLDATSIESAMKILHRTEYITRNNSPPTHEDEDEDEDEVPPSPSGSPVPPWVLFYLISHKVRAPPHATGPMLSLTLSCLNCIPPELKGGLIILSMFQLAKFNAVLPMKLLTSHFLRLDLAPKHHASNISAHASKIYFNLLLQAIARNPVHSVQSASSTVELLKAMDSRKLTLWQETFDELLKDRFVVLELTKWLRERAFREGYVPKSGQLVEYVKLFTGSQPAIENEERYQQVVEELQRSDGKEFFTTREGKEDRLSAIQFLQGLVEPPSPTTTKPVSLSLPVVEEEVTEPNPSGFDDSIIPVPLPSFIFSPHRDYESLSQRLQTEWKAGFTKTIKSTSNFSAREVVSFFEWGIPTTISSTRQRIRPTLSLYTELIRGLLVRGERSSNNPTTRTNGAFLLAEKYFCHLRSTGFVLDSHAVAVGLEAFTRVGKPNKAFGLLNEWCLVEGLSSSLPAVRESREVNTNVKDLFQKIHLSTIGFSDFMTSLMRVGRYDCVFWLFENSVRLYEVYPDSRAVSVVLQTARKAQRDAGDSWDSFWSLLKKGGKQDRQEEEERREEGSSLRSLYRMVGTSDELVHYQPGNLWDGESPVDRLRKVFWGCVVPQASLIRCGGSGSKEHDDNGTWTTYTDPLNLPTVVSPARPFIQPSDTSFSFLDSLSVPFPSSSYPRPRLTLPDLLRNKNIDLKGLRVYPQVMLQDTHFRDYILLLGLAPQGRSLFRQEQEKEGENEREVLKSKSKYRNEEPEPEPRTNTKHDHDQHHIPPITELPLVLGWQRYLGIPPSRDTIAAAIVLFGEYGGGEGDVPPLVDEIRRWTGRGRGEEEASLTAGWAPGGEFVRFVRWIESWVEEVEPGRRGEDQMQMRGKKSLMPDAGMFTKWRKIVGRMRDGRTRI